MKLINVNPEELDNPLVQNLIQGFKEHFDPPPSDDVLVLRHRENDIYPEQIIIYIDEPDREDGIHWDEKPKGLLL